MQAYQLLKLQWDSYFSDKLVSIYNQFHENECLILFVKHYPRTFLKDKFDALAEYYNYAYACYCMGPDYVGQIDKQKMEPDEWLQLMITFKQPVSESEVEAILYFYVANKLYQTMWTDANGRLNGYSLLKMFNVRKVVRYMGYLGMVDAILRFAKICKQAETIAEPLGHINSDIVIQDYFNKIGELLPHIKVEDEYHNVIKEWVEKGQPVYDYINSEKSWWYSLPNTTEDAQRHDSLEPIDRVPF